MEEYEMEDSTLQDGETLEEYLSHQDSYCEAILGDVFYNIKGEMSIE